VWAATGLLQPLVGLSPLQGVLAGREWTRWVYVEGRDEKPVEREVHRGGVIRRIRKGLSRLVMDCGTLDGMVRGEMRGRSADWDGMVGLSRGLSVVMVACGSMMWGP